MPVPFDDPSPDPACTEPVAWLRLIDEGDGRGVRAALLQTSMEGQPLEFCFTRTARPEPDGQDGAPRSDPRCRLARSLFHATGPSPILVLGLADEVPREMFSGTVRPRVPLCACRIGGGDSSNPAGPESAHGPGQLALAWNAGTLRGAGRHALDTIRQWSNPLEPFERATRALAEAFRDEHIQSITAVPGLCTVFRLPPSPAQPEASVDPIATAHDAGGEWCGPAVRATSSLVERLWALLAAPAAPGRDFALHWPGELMPFQRDGVNALLGSRRLLLADDMGLGKTLQAIAALRILRTRHEIRTCLVAAPAGLLDHWRRELAGWAPELSAIIIRGSASDRDWQWAAESDVTLVSYDTLRSDLGENTRSLVSRRVWDVVVADEVQRIKNRNATSDALKRLRRRRSWALTGTPVENDEEDLASIVEFVDYDHRREVTHRYRPGVELRARHGELQLRRRKSEVLADLPTKQVAKLVIELGPRQRESYDRAERNGIVYLKSLGAEVGVRHVLELITRLKQICNADPRTDESSKLADIRARLDRLAAQGHRALLFSQYTSDTCGTAAAASYLHEVSPLVITGEVPVEERTRIIERFKRREEHKVLILSLRAGGLGLDLQEASYVFHLDRWWNPAIERQAEDRAHRIGQTVKVNVVKYSCARTIEERIDAILERKQNVFDRLVDDVSLDLSTRLSREELFGLFGLGRCAERIE